ncbi:MAG: prepilin-type N-terminal cleavage/methylation domain-containing protein [Pirellulales bacterium]
MNRSQAPIPVRRGFSLLEVVLALAILTGAIAVLGELVRLGMHNAHMARDLTRAQLLCESKLAEIAAGITPAEPAQQMPFETTLDFDESTREWLYSIEMEPVDEPGMMCLRVTVYQDLPPEKKPLEFSLTRWIRDPNIDLSAEETAAEEESSSTSSSSKSSGSSSSSTSGGDTSNTPSAPNTPTQPTSPKKKP